MTKGVSINRIDQRSRDQEMAEGNDQGGREGVSNPGGRREFRLVSTFGTK